MVTPSFTCLVVGTSAIARRLVALFFSQLYPQWTIGEYAHLEAAMPVSAEVGVIVADASAEAPSDRSPVIDWALLAGRLRFVLWLLPEIAGVRATSTQIDACAHWLAGVLPPAVAIHVLACPVHPLRLPADIAALGRLASGEALP